MYDALPPESRTAHAMLIAPDKPAEGAPCVVHLAATGDHGYARRTHLGLPLVQQASLAGVLLGGRAADAQLSSTDAWRPPRGAVWLTPPAPGRRPPSSVQGIATLALESPYYGQRKPAYQQVCGLGLEEEGVG